MIDFNQLDEQSLRGIDVHELLPQQEPFVMVGCLTHVDEVRTISETLIRPDNLFVEDGRFSASGLVENIAQTCAARIGFVNKYVNSKGVHLLGPSRTLRSFRSRVLERRLSQQSTSYRRSSV